MDITFLKTNISPKNRWLEADSFPCKTGGPFSGAEFSLIFFFGGEVIRRFFGRHVIPSADPGTETPHF